MHLHIPIPCHEDWDAMTPRDQGRHCAACQKTVVDFTAMCDAEILAFFERYRHGTVCGQLRTSQLAQRFKPKVEPKGPWRAAASFLVGLCLGVTAYGQQPIAADSLVNKIIEARNEQSNIMQRGRVVMQSTYLHGTVRKKSNGAALGGAVLAAYDDKGQLMTGIVADERGRFKLNMVPRGAVLLEITHPGYQYQRFELPRKGKLIIELVAETSSE